MQTKKVESQIICVLQKNQFCTLTEYSISKMLQNIFHGRDGIYGIWNILHSF